MDELGELSAQLLARFDQGLSFLLDHHLPSHEAGAAALICDQTAQRLLRDGNVDADAWAEAVRQSWLDYIDHHPGTTTAQPATSQNNASSNKLISLLDELEDLDRQVVLRYYRSGQEKSVISCALELSDYHFNQILARVKYRYSEDPKAATAESELPMSRFGDRLDRYLLHQATEKEARDTELALLEQPAIIREAEVTAQLIGAVRQAHLAPRWRLTGERGHDRATDRPQRRRGGRGRFFTRSCLGAAASVVCVVGIIGSWIMWDMQRIDAPMDQIPSAVTVPLRIAQTRGHQPSAFLELHSDVSSVNVSLDIGTPQNTRYRVSLINAAGELLWQQRDIMPADDELLRFLIGSEFLSAGVHRFIVEPIDGPGHRIQLAFQIETLDSV